MKKVSRVARRAPDVAALDRVQSLVDLARDGLDLRAELALNAVKGLAVVVRDEVDRNAEVPEAPAAADAVQVRLREARKVKVDDDVHGLNVDAAREDVGAHEVAAGAATKVVEDPAALRLDHLRVDVEAGVAQLGDLARKELDAVGGVAEDDRLVDLQLGEERVEALHLLALVDKGVKLGDAAQRELVHQVDAVRLLEPAVRERLDRLGEGRRVEQDLPVGGRHAQERLDVVLELGRQQLVRLVHHHDLAVVELGDAARGQVLDAPGRADDDVHGLPEAQDVLLEVGAAGRDHDLEPDVL
eukprot:Unigene5819_Nuclearia_a/m.17776 Unigene5819_Nuclearia_a/g.17776  ORF Unigene5819_Nuclearia_a/g.17776 Unigene5819_Nuclearia_a/m.17776 type:complete len:300 (-) Unigene5819_Nuclearia_a:422-1321(-)